MKHFSIIFCVCFHCTISGRSTGWENGNTNTDRQKENKNLMRLPISKDRQCNLNREVNNVTKRRRIWENTLNVYPCNPFQSQAAFFNGYSLFTGTANTYTWSLALFYNKEDDLHLIISYNIHRHFINVLAHFSASYFSYSVFLKKSQKK